MPAPAGVEVNRRGWVAIVADEDRLVRSLLAPTFRHGRERLGDLVLIGVDTRLACRDQGCDRPT